MTTKARLARLEGTLSPKEATLAWLAEAHRFPTLPAHVAWLVDQPLEAAPFWRVPEQAERAVRAAMRGEPRSAVEAAAHQAVRDAVFLVELVIRLNVEAEETIRTEGLRYAVLFWQMRAVSPEANLSGEGASHHGKPGSTAPSRTWCAEVIALVTRLRVVAETRKRIERECLDGHPTLFPDAIELEAHLRESVERLASLGDSPSPLTDGHLPTRRHTKVDLEAIRPGGRTQAPIMATRVFGAARLAAFEMLGAGATVSAIAARQFRAGG